MEVVQERMAVIGAQVQTILKTLGTHGAQALTTTLSSPDGARARTMNLNNLDGAQTLRAYQLSSLDGARRQNKRPLKALPIAGELHQVTTRIKARVMDGVQARAQLQRQARPGGGATLLNQASVEVVVVAVVGAPAQITRPHQRHQGVTAMMTLVPKLPSLVGVSGE